MITKHKIGIAFFDAGIPIDKITQRGISFFVKSAYLSRGKSESVKITTEEELEKIIKEKN